MDEYLDAPVESKLHPPGPRKEWVPRRELVRHLAATEGKLVLIQAPAGFGKTTVAAQWRAAELESRPFAWVSLDRGDDDPARLWWHVVVALGRVCPGLGGAEWLTALRTMLQDIKGRLLPTLVNALAELSEPVVLVLDDCHLVTERRCHEQIEFLLLNLPQPARIALVTRAAPPLQLARLRAAGDMAEIGMSELRFTGEETAGLVAVVAGFRLADDDLAGLTRRTEGWPAGVYLAALSMRDHADPATFVRQFSGENRYIADFLFEEVISRQPGGILRFLTRTAILDRFTAPLCAAVTDMPHAAEIIDTLERENLFLLALDENRQWFRYHQLFAQVLRSQLALREPALVPELHRRASVWHRLHGDPAEAIEHAIAAGDTAAAVDLIAGQWYSYVNAGRMETVRGWINALGDELVSENPLAAHSAAWVAALCGEPEKVRRLVPVIETAESASPLPDGMRSLRSSAALLRGTFGFDGIRVMRESAVVAAELESDPRSPWYILARSALGFSLYLSGEPGTAETVRQAMLGEASGPLARLLSLCSAALAAVQEGRLSQAEAIADAARRLADDTGLSSAPQSTLARTVAGIVRYGQGRLDEARAELEQALRARRAWLGLSPWPTLELLLQLASVLLDLDDRAGAAELLAEATDVLTALPDGADHQWARLESLQHRLSLQSGGAAPTGLLTERETMVLRLLRGTLTLREAAQELGMSSNTIKTHTRAIYRKLGVSGRGGAVVRARELGLL